MISAWELLIPAIVGSLVTLGTICLGLWLFFDSVRFSWTAVRATGKVVRIHSQYQQVSRSNDSHTWTETVIVHYPIIAFADLHGAQHEVRANVGNLCNPGYEIGAEVPILFLPKDPQKMRIHSFASLYFNVVCLFAIGTCGGIITAAFWFYYARLV